MLEFIFTIRVSNSLDPDQAPRYVCKGYQQTTNVATNGQGVNYKTTCWHYVLAKTLLFLFGSSFFHLARVVATANSEPG